MEQINLKQNLKEKCKYYPCHELKHELFDCRTCYCPIYSVCSKYKNIIFGGYYLKDTVWACEKCSFIHKKDVVEKIIQLQKENKSEEDIYFSLIDLKSKETIDN